MANPAAELRQKAQERWAGATVVQRGRNSIKHQHPTEPNRYMLDTSIGPLHIANSETEIDTAWVASVSPWQWQMLQADYNVRAKSAFNGAPLLEYSNPAHTEWVTLQPRQLNWHNDRGDVQVAGAVQGVTASVNDDVLRWSGAFGAGRHFEYQAQPARLAKKLHIDSYASLPAPTSQTLTGGNPVLQLQFQFAWSSTLTVWVDGQQWTGAGGSPTLTTANDLEFRRVDNSVSFYFRHPFALDAAEGQTPAVMRVSRSGPNILVEVRVSQVWLASAVYPVYIDPTIDPTVGADADDGKTAPSSDWSNDGNVWAGNYFGVWNAWHRFTGISGLAGKTIDVSYITTSGGGKLGSPNVRIYAERAASPAAPTSTGDYNGRTPTTAYTAWGGSDALSPTPSLNAPLQELVDNHDPSTILILSKDNGSSANENRYSFGNYGFGVTKTLHIEYSDGAPGSIELTVNDAHVTTQTDTADALTQVHILAASDAAVTTQADTFALTQTYELSVNDAAVTTQSDNVVFTQVHVLAVDDSASTTQSDNATLTQVHELAVNDAESTTQADNVSLAGQADLTVQDASVTTQADAPSLTQVHELTVASASVTTQSDNVTLTQLHELVVQDAAVTTQTDAAVLTQAHTLAVQDAASVTQSDNATLTQTHVLSVADVFVTTQTDHVSFSGEATLTVANAVVTTQTDALAITQAHELVAQDAAVTTQADALTLTQAHNLTMAGGYVGVFADNVTLTQLHELSAADAYVTTFADAFALSSGALTPSGVGGVKVIQSAQLATIKGEPLGTIRSESIRTIKGE